MITISTMQNSCINAKYCYNANHSKWNSLHLKLYLLIIY